MTLPLPSDLPVGDLARSCAEQTKRYFSKLSSDPQYCFELFRRALVERCEESMHAMVNQYQSLVRRWARQATTGSSVIAVDDVVNAAFFRFWRAITPARFSHFHTLSRLLVYLRRCVVTAYQDMARREKFDERSLDERREGDQDAHDSEDMLLDAVEASELWQHILSRLQDESERILMIASFAYGLPPRELVARWPDLFLDVETVYKIKERVLRRLSRDPRLGGFFDDRQA